MPLLIYLRHGETDWNRERRMQGQKDIPLNDHGRAQARGNGERLKAHLATVGIGADQFDYVVSPLGRARETMQIVRAALGLPAEGARIDPRLIEITFGAWEGFTLDELAQRDPDRVRAREADKWGMVPPGGESYAMLYDRILPWWQALERPTVAVAHGGVWRVLQVALDGNQPEHRERAGALDVVQDRFIVVENGEARWV